MTWANHKRAAALAATFLVLAGAAAPARADHAPVIALPGHPDVPVIIDGRDATYRLVVGDWGLHRPGAVPVIVYGPPACCVPAARGYYPSTGTRPRYGRHEYETPRRIVPPAPVYYREWSAGPGREPASIYPPYAPPEVIVAPRGRR
jgi:hypothetical protein